MPNNKNETFWASEDDKRQNLKSYEFDATNILKEFKDAGREYPSTLEEQKIFINQSIALIWDTAWDIQNVMWEKENKKAYDKIGLKLDELLRNLLFLQLATEDTLNINIEPNFSFWEIKQLIRENLLSNG